MINGQRLPFPEGPGVCDFCEPNKNFKNWNELSIHITLIHNDHGKTREFWKNKQPPQEVLQHPDWSGFEDAK